MARKQRIELEGGLYHIITRGVDSRDIFHSPHDHEKFLALVSTLKAKLPFYLYAYCLMTNHLHLLIERRTDDIGRIMHRILTGYGQYYNRRYKRVGHVLQGRHKAILCQKDAYLAELVRYIHLNPVRARMVDKPEDYPFSSYRAYMSLAPRGAVDVDPVLRRFGAKKDVARENFARFAAEGVASGHEAKLYETSSGILGSEEFVDKTIHRIGQFDALAAGRRRRDEAGRSPFEPAALLAAVESVCGTDREEFCSATKTARLVNARETMILVGRGVGAGTTALAGILNISLASVSRRYDSASNRLNADKTFADLVKQAEDQYKLNANAEESQ